MMAARTRSTNTSPAATSTTQPQRAWPADREGFKMLWGGSRASFPDLTITFEDQVAEGDKVSSRVTLRGTNQGDFMGMPATGKSIEVRGIRIDLLLDGKIVEHWTVFDQMGMMQQLGAARGG